MIYIGRVYGGPEVRGSPTDKAISRVVQLLGPQAEDERGSLDVVVHVPGSLFKADFEGVRTGKFSKKQRMLAIQIAMPQHIASGDGADVQRFLLDAVREAVRLGRDRFEKAGITYPEEEYLRKIDAIQAALVH